MIRKWVLKAIVQKSISFLPYKNNINYFFQKYVTKGIELTDLRFNNKISSAKAHLTYLQQHTTINQVRCLELGTGWYPIVPLYFYLNGVQQIYTIDLNAHLSKKFLLIAIKKYFEWDASGQLTAFIPQKNEQRWQQLQLVYKNQHEHSLETLLSNLHIESIIGDARHINLPKQSVDFVCSNNTFEHIYQEVLKGILLEFKRLLKPAGYMSHLIDMSDHFAHLDRGISMYNFLKFTEKQWRWIDNSIQPQNRLRFHQYQQMYHQLNIPFETGLERMGDTDALLNLDIKKPFCTFSKEQLAIIHGYLFTNLQQDPTLQQDESIYKQPNAAQPE